MDAKEYIKTLLSEQYPDLDVRDGSPLSQFLIVPAAYLASYFMWAMNYFYSNYSISNYENMPTSVMEAIAANFFVTRNSGSYAKGYVRVYFNSPVELNLSTSDISFEDINGNTYSLYEDLYISETTMSHNITDDGMYYYADMYVVADSAGSAYAIDAHQITQIASGIDEYVKVDNLDAFEGGSDAETNEEFYNRIASSISPRDILINQNSIEYKLTTQFPEIQEVLSIGFGDSEMQRDILWDVTTADKNYYILSYMDNKRFPNNRLIYDNMVTLTSESGVYSIDHDYGTDTELTDSQYVKARAVDNDFVSLTVGLFIDEKFDVINSTFYSDWFTIASGYIYQDTGGIPEAQKVHDQIYIDETNNYLVLKDSQTVAPIAIYNTALSTAERNNLIIEGKFKTDPIESNDRGTTNYVLLTNNPYYNDPYYWNNHFAGFGLAWHTSTDDNAINVYLVDHNGIERNIIVGPMVIDHAQDVLDNAGTDVLQKPYLAAAHVDITGDTWYNFQIEIDSDYRIKAWVWNASGPKPVSPSVEYGGGDTILDFSDHVKLMLSVDYAPSSNSQQYAYYYDYIRARSLKGNAIVVKSTFTLGNVINSTYTQGKFYVYTGDTPQSDVVQFELHYKSGSSDMVSVFTAPEITYDGTNKVFVLTKVDPWKYDSVVTVGSETVSQFELWVYYDPQTDVLSPLYLDSVEFETISLGTHAGGYVDAYCHTSPPLSSTVESIASDASGRIDISTSNGFTLPIYEITSVVTHDTQTNVPFTVYCVTDTLRYSHRENIYITITNSIQVPLDITYTHYSNYSDYQTLADSSATRELVSDVLIKEFFPAELHITIGLSGDYDESDLKSAICSYVNSLTTNVVTSTEIEDVAQKNGATVANITDLHCNVKLPGNQSTTINWNNTLGTLEIDLSSTSSYYSGRCCRFLCKEENIIIG